MQPDDDGGRSQRTLVQRGYDVLADEYAADRDTHGDDELLDRLLADAPDGRILDAGCGGGPFLGRLPTRRPTVGLDFSHEQVTRANDVTPGRIVQGDMTALPFAADSFAAVTALYSVIHVPAAQHADVYAEFARLLRPGGVVLVTIGTENWFGRNENWLDGGAPMEWSILGPEESAERLEAAGFEVYDEFGVVDTVGDDVDRNAGRIVDADSEDAEKLFVFARLTN